MAPWDRGRPFGVLDKEKLVALLVSGPPRPRPGSTTPPPVAAAAATVVADAGADDSRRRKSESMSSLAERLTGNLDARALLLPRIPEREGGVLGKGPPDVLVISHLSDPKRSAASCVSEVVLAVISPVVVAAVDGGERRAELGEVPSSALCSAFADIAERWGCEVIGHGKCNACSSLNTSSGFGIQLGRVQKCYRTGVGLMSLRIRW